MISSYSFRYPQEVVVHISMLASGPERNFLGQLKADKQRSQCRVLLQDPVKSTGIKSWDGKASARSREAHIVRPKTSNSL